MSEQPIIVEKVVNAPVSRVWKAITDKKQMKEWYFDVSGFEPKVGFEFQFEGGNEGRTYTHVCKITEIVENKKLQHTWTYKGYEGESVVTWELTDMGGKTKVRLTHRGLETFPKLPDFDRKNFEKGWTDIVGSLLPDFVTR
ncbi:MAG TPA: SRPBCC domain-containing protein [Cyclobacteriaceae bacterium]|nr:SRPBCC domain-containing protein [Cyclobacteriaceae bacterium]